MLTAKILEDANGQILVFPKEIRIEQKALLIRKVGKCLILTPVVQSCKSGDSEQQEHGEPFAISAGTLAMMDKAMESMRNGEVSPPINLNGTAEVPENIRRDE